MVEVQIIPSVLAANEAEFQEKIQKIIDSGEFDEGWIQIDLADGRFVNNTTVEAEVIGKYPIGAKKEAHLMVEEPVKWIDALKQARVDRVILHIEAQDIENAIEVARQKGLQVGLALNPETPVAKVVPFMGKIDEVLLMSVHPGFGGQEFIPETLDKVRELVGIIGDRDLIIEVDGGVNESVAKDLVKSGANYLVIGEHLIYGEIAQNLEKIWEAVTG